MKKILLIIFIFLLTGCYDYNELTDLAIVSSMVIDYKDNTYVVGLEILQTKKDVSKASFFMEGRGDTFEEALNDIYSKSPKHIYYNYIFSVVLSKSILADKLESIYDFFLIENDVRKDSVFVMCDDVENLKKFETEDKMSIGETIKNIFNYSEIETGKYKTANFRDILNSCLNKKNYYITSIIIDDNTLKLSDVFLIHENKLSLKLDANYVLFANILDNKSNSFVLRLDDEIFEVYKNKMSTDVQNNQINFNLNVDVRLYGKSKSENFKKNDVENIEIKINQYLNLFMRSALKYAIDENIDIYNLDYKYYQKYPDDAYTGVFKDLKYSFLTHTTFNEKGLLLNQIGER